VSTRFFARKNRAFEQPQIVLGEGNNFCDHRGCHKLAANCTRRVRRSGQASSDNQSRAAAAKNVVTVRLCV
jgi:hypothetical protein